MNTASPLLSVEDVHVAYGPIAAVKGVSLVLRAGQTLALLGANGAGKSTLLKAIVGAIGLRAGHIHFDGQRVDQLPAHRRVRLGIGYSPEGRRVFPGLTVLENLHVASFADVAQTRARIDEMFQLFPALKAKDKLLAWSLSGGQQQMLAIARALMGTPRLLLLDEPSLGLSPRLTDEVLAHVPEIAKSGTAVILAEQNASKALRLVDHALVLQTGEPALDGPAAALRGDPRIQAAFLGVLPV